MKTVFIADDDPEVLTAVKRHISTGTIQVKTFTSGPELREATEVPDVVILDGNLAREFGWDSIPFIKEHWPNAKIVGFSSYAGHGPMDYTQMFLDAGAHEYRSKKSSLIEFSTFIH